jgi:type VI secretion system protein VasD
MPKRLRIGGLAAAALLFSTGCAWFGKKDRVPRPLDVTVRAAERVNPDESGQSLPTVVRVYQLKAAGAMEAADYGALYGADKEALGEDLLQVDEFVVPPGAEIAKRIARVPEATAIAAVAVLRRPSGASWRSIVSLAAGRKPKRLVFQVEDYRIEQR